MERHAEKRAGEQTERIEKTRARLRSLIHGPLKRSIQAAGLWASLTSFTQPPHSTLEDLRGRVESPTQERLPSYEQMRHDLERWIGRERLQEMVPVRNEDIAPEVRLEHRRSEERESRVRVEGFEKIGLSNELVREYIVQAFPRHWTSRTEVLSVRYTTEHIPMSETYGLTGNESGHCTLSSGDEPSEITTTVDALDENSYGDETDQLLFHVLPHEFAHALDMTNAATVDPHARLETLWRVVHLLQSDGRPHFPYVESIRNEDPQEQLRNQAVEFFAEAFATRFRLARMPYSEPGIVFLSQQAQTGSHYASDYQATLEGAEATLRMMERAMPEMDWEQTHQTLMRSVHQLHVERNRHSGERLVHQIHSPALSSDMMEALQMSQDDVSAGFQMSRFSEADTDDCYQEAWHLYQQQESAVLERLRASLTLESRVAFEQWIELVREVVTARAGIWYASANNQWMRRMQNTTIADLIPALNRHIELLRHDSVAWQTFERAAHAAVRILATGEGLLPPEMDRLAQQWVEEERRLVEQE